jgi:hypothetical protein
VGVCPDHVPGVVVRVEPATAVPEIEGAVVLDGADEEPGCLAAAKKESPPSRNGFAPAEEAAIELQRETLKRTIAMRLRCVRRLFIQTLVGRGEEIATPSPEGSVVDVSQ